MIRRWFSKPLKQKTRRFLVIFSTAILFPLYLYFLLTGFNFSLLSMLIMLAFILIGARLTGLTGRFTNLQEQELDEYEHKLRAKAHFISYRILSGLLIVIGPVIVITSTTFLNSDAGAAVYRAGFWGQFILVLALPVWLIAWLEPDPIEDDDTVSSSSLHLTNKA